ncbi:MAG TPA: 1,4-alpha-glucan branching protein domain-containing protein, partial [Pyrinomonadaceae bacterium]
GLDLLGALRPHAAWTSSATHAVLPLLATEAGARLQVETGIAGHRRRFGGWDGGFWLPECAYEPGLEELLKEAAIEYFISDTHAILYGDPRPRYGVYAPVVCPNGIAVFARDVETSQQVWSAEIGYPGSDVYREFYRDIGWDLPLEYLKPHLHADAARRHLGLKYHRITGRDVTQQKKAPYIPSVARDKAAENATHFIGERIRQARELRAKFDGRPPMVVSPYDAELFGHWWYEGPQFLDFFFRGLHWDQSEIEAITPGDFLDSAVPIQVQQPSASSWGESGYFQVWINEKTSWMYPYQHDAERRMTEFANKYSAVYDGHKKTLFDQMARELVLAQSSDWAFQIYKGTTVEYSTKRFLSHIQRFDLLAKMLDDGAANDELFNEIAARDNIFSEIDFRGYCSKQIAG